jgi:hypothetical protein
MPDKEKSQGLSLELIHKDVLENSMKIRARTMQIILKKLCDNNIESMEILGKEIGNDLTDDKDTWPLIKNIINNSYKSEEIKIKIKEWLDLEAKAKWAEKFDLSNNVDSEYFSGQIIVNVEKCFLAFESNQEYEDENRNLCLFLKGYIETVISDLMGFGIEVQSCQKGDNQNCTLILKRKKSAN